MNQWSWAVNLRLVSFFFYFINYIVESFIVNVCVCCASFWWEGSATSSVTKNMGYILITSWYDTTDAILEVYQWCDQSWAQDWSQQATLILRWIMDAIPRIVSKEINSVGCGSKSWRLVPSFALLELPLNLRRLHPQQALDEISYGDTTASRWDTQTSS